MREPEFLPAWYPQIRRRKRMVVLQAYMIFLLGGGLGLWATLAQRNVRGAEVAASVLDSSYSQAQSQLKQLHEMENKEEQLKQEDQVNRRLGVHVAAARLVNTIEGLMPPEMSLTDLEVVTQEQLGAPTSLAAAQQAQSGTIERRLKVKVQGVAPSDDDIARFLAKLGNVTFFEEVAMSYARDRAGNGHLMREFEVGFSLKLNAGN